MGVTLVALALLTGVSQGDAMIYVTHLPAKTNSKTPTNRKSGMRRLRWLLNWLANDHKRET